MKKLQRSRQAHFLDTSSCSANSFLLDHFVLRRLCVCDPKVSLLAGYLSVPRKILAKLLIRQISEAIRTSDSDKSKQVFEKDEDAQTRSSLCVTNNKPQDFMVMIISVPCHYCDSEIMEQKDHSPWISSALQIKIHLLKFFPLVILKQSSNFFDYHSKFI